MRKRILSILMAMLMVVAYMPTIAFAGVDPGHSHSYTNGLCECGLHDGNHDEWTEWGDSAEEYTALPVTEGTYYLTHDVILSTNWSVPSGTTNLCLNGYVIKLAEDLGGWEYPVIFIGTSSTLNLYDCDNTTNHYFNVEESGLWTLADEETDNFVTGGCITGGTGYRITEGSYGFLYGGGIYIDGNYSNYGTLNMFGGNIIGNQVKTDAANYTPKGGGVYNKGNFKMTGGFIVGNIAENPYKETLGGGVYPYNTVKIGGTAIIQENYARSSSNAATHKDNLYASNVEILQDDGKPLGGMSVGIYTSRDLAPGTKSSDCVCGTEADIKYLTSDNGNYGLIHEENEYGDYIYLHRGGFCLCNGSAFKADYPDAEEFVMKISSPTSEEPLPDNDYKFVGWYTERVGGQLICKSEPASVIAGKDYYAHWTYKNKPVITETLYVYDDCVTIGQKAIDNEDINEELGAYGLSYTEADGVIADGTVITVIPIFSEESIKEATGGVVLGYPEDNPAEDVKFVLNNGVIRGCCALDESIHFGGGVSAYPNTSFVMNGGEISNNTAYGGGGVYVYKDAEFVMNDGEIKSNYAMMEETPYGDCFGAGGGVCLEKGGTFVAGDGIITNNTAYGEGGGVYIAKGTNTDEDDPNLYYCLAGGTPITLADGSRTAVENLKIGDTVRVFDHETGELSTATIFNLQKTEDVKNDVFTLHFTNSIDVTAVGGHCFFNMEENKYVTLTPDNATSYIGKQFYNADADRWEKLEKVTAVYGGVDSYSIVTDKTLNSIANGMLSSGDALYYILINIFAFGDDLIVDKELKAEDIAKYGLWDYSEASYATKETYDALNLQYLKVAIGKGMITPDQLAFAGEYQQEHDQRLVREEKDGQLAGKTSLTITPYLSDPEPISSVILGGTVQIFRNFNGNGDIDNVFMWDEGPKITIGNDTNGVSKPVTGANGMTVGVTVAAGGPYIAMPFAAYASASDLSCFSSDKSTFYVALNDNDTDGDTTDDYLELKAPAAEEYVINLVQTEGGRISSNLAVATEGTTVNLSANAASGYHFVEWQAEGGLEITSTGSFEMPGENVKIAARFEEDPSTPPTPPGPGPSGSDSKVVPVSGEQNTIKVETVVKGKTATVKDIPDEDIEKIISNKVETGIVQIDLSEVSKNITTAELPAATVDKIAEATAEAGNDAAGMAVKLPAAMVSFDAKATQEISEQATGENIQLVVEDKSVSLNAVQKEAVGKLETAIIIDAYLTSGGSKLCTEEKNGFGGGKATVTLPYEIKKGRTAAQYSVYYVAEDGRLEKLNATYDQKLGAFVFEISHFSNYAVAFNGEAADYANCPKDASCPITVFNDTKATAWYHDGVHYCLEKQLMNGYPDGTFKPGSNLTRAQVVMMLWNLDGNKYPNYYLQYKDIGASSWYTEAVRWATAEKIVNGYDADHFGPNDPVTREQLAKILYAYAKYTGVDTAAVTADTNTLSHNDVFTVSSWASEGVHYCIAAGILSGDANGNLNPKSYATRAEAACMFQRF